jgi:copper chaperone CopZ
LVAIASRPTDAVRHALCQVDGVTAVQVDAQSGWVVVTGESLDMEAIREAVGRVGGRAQL